MSYWKKFKKKYMGDRAFYRHYLLLAVPMILQNAITNLVSFLDNIMVGQLGTEQMSGVAIVNQLIFVFWVSCLLHSAVIFYVNSIKNISYRSSSPCNSGEFSPPPFVERRIAA